MVKTVNMTMIPWRYRHLGGIVNTIFLSRVNRWRLRRMVEMQKSENDVTVVIGVRNRFDYRLKNSLQSIRSQDYRRGKINITVVDYGSTQEHSSYISEACRDYHARHLVVDGVCEWNRSHCLNIGIRAAASKFIVTSDTDIIFSENYLSTVISELSRNPLSVIYSRMLDLPQDTCAHLEAVAASNQDPDHTILLQNAKPRSCGTCNDSINATYRCFYEFIGGYDEKYRLWGSEDNDLSRRFLYLGLQATTIYTKAYYLHQWHEKHEGVQGPDLVQAIRENEEYYLNNHSIKRNFSGWGMA